jgi:hypothetical protein
LDFLSLSLFKVDFAFFSSDLAVLLGDYLIRDFSNCTGKLLLRDSTKTSLLQQKHTILKKYLEKMWFL